MLKKIGEWFKHLVRYSHFRINHGLYRILFSINEGARPLNFTFVVFNREVLVAAPAAKSTKWMLYTYAFGRRFVLSR